MPRQGGGHQIRYINTARTPSVHACDLASEPDAINVPQYRELAVRAIYEVLQPLGVTERVLRDWLINRARYALPEELTNPRRQLAKQEVPIFVDLTYLYLDVI